jgi:hypothetical protein
VVRDSIEKSIIELEKGRKENEEKWLSVYASISELENLISKTKVYSANIVVRFKV